MKKICNDHYVNFTLTDLRQKTTNALHAEPIQPTKGDTDKLDTIFKSIEEGLANALGNKAEQLMQHTRVAIEVTLLGAYPRFGYIVVEQNPAIGSASESWDFAYDSDSGAFQNHIETMINAVTR